MPYKRSDASCRALIKSLARKLGAKAKLITTRLMNEEDKNDLRNGNLPISSFEEHIKAWMAKGQPDYAHGEIEPLEDVSVTTTDVSDKNKPVIPAPLVSSKLHNNLKLRKPFIRLEESLQSGDLKELHHDEQSDEDETSPTL